MTLEQMIAQAREALSTLLAKREEKTGALVALRDKVGAEGSDVTEDQVRSAIAERDAFDPQIEEARGRLDELVAEKSRDDAAAALATRVGGVKRSAIQVTREPDVYRKGGEHSYFRDLWHATAYGTRDAADRLRRNDAQVFEARALNTTDGAIGEFVPPLWLLNEFEAYARPGRVFANQVRNQPLPGGTDSISLPRITGGTAVAEQAAQGNALQETDMTSDSVTAKVATLGGVQTVSLQLVEQSPVNIDQIILADLADDYAQKVDVFLLTNNVANKRGVLNVTGINSVTYTDASPTIPEFWPKLVDAKRQVGVGRRRPARAIFLTSTRWAWFEAGLDTNGRPYVSDDAASAIPLLGTDEGQVYDGLVGRIRGLSLPVFVDDNIPVNLGAGTNEDRVIVTRPEDITLYEGARKAEAFRETKAKEAQVVFRLYAYVAAMTERSPKSISVISGTGLVQPTF